MSLTKQTNLSLCSGSSLICFNDATKSGHLPSFTNPSNSSVKVGQPNSGSSGHIVTRHVATHTQCFANKASLRFSNSESRALEEVLSLLTLGVEPEELVISWIMSFKNRKIRAEWMNMTSIHTLSPISPLGAHSRSCSVSSPASLPSELGS